MELEEYPATIRQWLTEGNVPQEVLSWMDQITSTIRKFPIPQGHVGKVEHDANGGVRSRATIDGKMTPKRAAALTLARAKERQRGKQLTERAEPESKTPTKKATAAPKVAATKRGNAAAPKAEVKTSGRGIRKSMAPRGATKAQPTIEAQGGNMREQAARRRVLIIHDWDSNNYNQAQIAERHSVSGATIHRILKDAGKLHSQETSSATPMSEAPIQQEAQAPMQDYSPAMESQPNL